MAGILQKLIQATGKSADEIMTLLGKKGAPAVIEEADEMLPAIRKTTLPVEVGPEVLGKGTSKAAPMADDFIDAELVAPKVSTMDAVKDFASKNKGKIAGGLTVAELARQMMGGGNEQPPVPPMQAKQLGEAPLVMSDDLAQKAIDEANNQGTVAPTPITPARRSLGVDAAEKVEQRSPSGEIDLLQSAQEADSQNQFYNTLARSGIMIGSGIAGSKGDYTGIEALEKNQGQNVKNVKEKQSYKKAQEEMNDEGKLRDVNSSISKTARELAKKLGINVDDKISAKQLQDAGLPLGTLLSTQMAAEGRKEAAQLQRESTGAQKESSNQLKVQGSVDRQVTQLLKSKDMEGYNAAKDAIFALDSAMESGDDKIKGGAAFMQYAKIAQGDNSVVRDGDMAQLAGKYNYTSVDDMFNKLKAQAAGGNFGSTELAAMKEVASKTQEIKGRRVKELMSPIIKRTGSAGLDISESLDPAVVKEFGPSDDKALKTEELTTPKGTRTFKSAQQPGSIVTVKSGKKYRIAADGVTGEEI